MRKHKMKQRNLSVLLALLAAFTLLATACGGADDAADTATDAAGEAADAAGEAADAAGDAAGEAADAAGDAADDMVDGAANAMPGEGVSVTAARANWSTGYFQAAVYAELLSELGYDVSDPALNEFPPSNGYLAMAEGGIDFWPNSWYPGHRSWYENELTDGSLVGDHLEVLGEELMSAGLEGLLITKTVAEEHGIESLQQIYDDPELLALFDSDEDGVAEVYGCPEDWTCDDILADTITFNGWDDKIMQVKAGYDAMIADSAAKAGAGEPVIQYTWSPSGYLTKLIPGDNVLWLNLGTNDNVLDGSTNEDFNFADVGAAPLGDTCTADPCFLGWPNADIQVTANADFVAANPAAAELFRQVKLSVIDVANQNVKYSNGENTEDDVKRQATEWVDANRDLVDGWLDAARAAA